MHRLRIQCLHSIHNVHRAHCVHLIHLIHWVTGVFVVSPVSRELALFGASLEDFLEMSARDTSLTFLLLVLTLLLNRNDLREVKAFNSSGSSLRSSGFSTSWRRSEMRDRGMVRWVETIELPDHEWVYNLNLNG